MIETLSGLLDLMKSYGAVRFYAKKLAPNDNSKNQIYLGGDFSVLNIIPHQGIYTDASEKAGSIRNRAKAEISFSWIDENGRYNAPRAQLILYPKYPEVRLSGILLGAKKRPSDVIDSRDDGRVLFIGITTDGQMLGYAVGAGTALANEVYAKTDLKQTGVFLEIPLESGLKDTRKLLIDKLTEICSKQWIMSQKLAADGLPKPYKARNGGGYTLEAELGITPNGYSEPDYLGWEIKQYAVDNFSVYHPKGVVTLMTPEPNGGLYKDKGIHEFMNLYGYADKSGKADRRNFGGIYTCKKGFHADTGLRLVLQGYDSSSGKITDMTGGIVLLSRDDEVAASWKFTSLMEHWTRKHAQAAYIPSMFREPPPEYAYGPRVLLCEQTDFSLFLKAVSDCAVYYDPAIKMEKASSESPAIKRRSQFRVRHNELVRMYYKHEYVELALV